MLDPLSWISMASSLSGEGGGSVVPGSSLSIPSFSSADGHSEVNNQFTTGAFALGGSASNAPAGVMNLTPLLLGAAALVALYFVARKVL